VGLIFLSKTAVLQRSGRKLHGVAVCQYKGLLVHNKYWKFAVISFGAGGMSDVILGSIVS
jgi:hypothetical protein